MGSPTAANRRIVGDTNGEKIGIKKNDFSIFYDLFIFTTREPRVWRRKLVYSSREPRVWRQMC